MNQIEKAQAFANLHRSGKPLLLYNIWDAGGAQAIANAGAKAIATASWAVAAAHGYADGQNIPLQMVLPIVSRIVSSVDLPVSVDFEAGYAEEPQQLAENVTQLINSGAVGINFEDQRIGGDGLYTIELQCERIAAIRRAAQQANLPLFINARCDLFLKQADVSKHAALMSEAQDRGRAYAEAGANGLFVPGLIDRDLLTKICAALPQPINVLMNDKAPAISDLAACGVARISYGPGPYRQAMARLSEQFAAQVA